LPIVGYFLGRKDIGLRNSLSISRNITVVIVGILIALRIIGINPTALTVVAVHLHSVLIGAPGI